MVSSHFGTPLGVGTSHGQLNSLDSPWPGLGEATTFPLIVFSTPLHQGYIEVALFPGTPMLESRNCPETVPGGVPGLWELITPDCRVGSRRGLNQSCSPHQALSNDVSHSQIGCREEVDSRLLVVGSQIASLTPGPSFAHNLGCRCPNGQCEAIFGSLGGLQIPNFGSVGLHPHTWPKWGCDIVFEYQYVVSKNNSRQNQSW